jgi:hypothetical protein
MIRSDDTSTQPASLAAIQVSLLELGERVDHQGGVLAGLDGLVRAHVAAEERRPRMSPAAIKAWGAAAVLVLGAAQTLLTSVRMNEAAAQGRAQQAEVARQKVLGEQLIATQRAIEDTSRATAQRTADEVRRAIREEQTEAERRAAMRVAPARGKR